MKIKRSTRIRSSFILALVLVAVAAAPHALAQEESKQEVLVEGLENGWYVAGSVKFSEVDGRFANFVGPYGGWLINHKFLLGGGGYGLTNQRGLEMGYGGLVLEYFINPSSLVNVSVKGLIGGGSTSWNWEDPFFVAEPEVKVNLNVTEFFRIGFGGGYRFVSGNRHDDRLRGPSATVDLKFGVF